MSVVEFNCFQGFDVLNYFYVTITIGSWAWSQIGEIVYTSPIAMTACIYLRVVQIEAAQ